LEAAATVVWWRGADGEIGQVELSHRELARRARAWRDELTGRDVVGQVAEPGSEVAVWETWAALAAGACLGPRPVATVLALTASELVALHDQDPSTLDGVRLLLLRGNLPDRYARRLRVRQQSLRVEPAAALETVRVAHRLRQLPLVREAVVGPARDRRRLAAYLVPDPGPVAGDGGPGGSLLAQRHVAQWRSLYDRTYADSDPADPTADFLGWNSSYTGAPMATEAMAEWREFTLDRIRSLRPQRVLEIGCGSGLLLFGLLDSCRQYLGTDFSPGCLARVRDHLTTLDRETRDRVTLLERVADDVTDLPPGGFDVVVLNSVVQYFPGAGYLARVLDGALRMATPDGTVFLGDLRHHGLQEAFYTSVELYRAVDLLPTDELYARVRRALENERELLVDPAYLTALAAERPEIDAVELMPKRGAHHTELTRFRYDAVLRLRPPAPPAPDPGPKPDPVAWYDWRRDVLTRSEIGWLLDHANGDAVGVTGVPNARVVAEVEAARLLTDPAGPNTAGELRIAADKAPSGLDPEELYQLGERRGWSVAVSLASHRPDGSLNVLFRRGEAATALVPGDLPAAGADGEPSPAAARPLTSDPLRGSLAGELEREAWRSLTGGGLPEHLRVSQVLVLDELPRTAGGEVDEAALPVPADPVEDATPAASGAVPPRTADELRLARIWEQALRVRSVDVRASFFELGGDSLLAIRVIDDASRVFGREVPLAALLQEPTIEGMAAALRAAPGPRTPLVEITPGTGTPFVCVHPAGGGVLCYAELARQLGPGQPFYALQARGVEGDEPPDPDLSTMAARYLAALRERQPGGPYLLGGYSMGGLVAYQMAQQLRAAGEPVGLLVLIDTPTPALIDELPDEAAVLGRLLAGLIELDPAELRAMPADARLRHVLAEAERAELVPPGLDPDRAQQLFRVYTSHLAAARSYQPRPYPGRTCLLRAAQSRTDAFGYGWDRLLTGEWETVEVPGDHETMVWPPHVQRLAEVLQTRLAAAMPG
jgi:thioesterase domain-containing protein/SAM-dependent methyltransferase/acyl carrier protein